MAKPFSMNYKQYDTSHGFGSPKEWRTAFNETMGVDEAKKHVGDRSPWALLGVLPNALWLDVVKAFRQVLATVHPDRCAVHGLSYEEATERSKIVIGAFTVLKKLYKQA